MKDRPLRSLTLSIRSEDSEDLGIVFADPSSEDLENLFHQTEIYILNLIRQALWPHQEKTSIKAEHASPQKQEHVSVETFKRELSINSTCSASDSQPDKDADMMSSLGLFSPDFNTQFSDLLDQYTPPHIQEDDITTFSPHKDDIPLLSQHGSIQALDLVADSQDGKEEGISITELNFESDRSIEKADLAEDIIKHLTDIPDIHTNHIEVEKKRNDFPCDHCIEVFPTKLILSNHIRQLNFDKAQVKGTSEDLSNETLNIVEVENGAEIKPDSTAKSPESTKKNSISAKKFSENAAEKSEKLALNTERELPRRFQCDQCQKNYKVKGELKKHRDSVHRGLKFPCIECTEILSSSQSLRRHVRIVHEVIIKKSKCLQCGKAFKDQDYLRKHMKIHEESTKSFVCQECGNIFKNSASLRTHIRIIHERNYKKTCEDCGKSFPNMHNLSIHAEMVHMKGEQYMCQICGKEMIGKNRLRNHMMTHPKGQKFVSCEQCGKEVAETQLRSHVYEAHKMQAYRYSCEFCNKRFDTKQHIQVHIRKHTGAKPFQCKGCGKYFPFVVSVRKHIRIFHNKDFSLIYYDASKDVSKPMK